MVIVDYADLLRPTRSSAEKRFDLENTYEELRAIAQIYKCPVWTASQTNRSGLNAEVITMEAISEALTNVSLPTSSVLFPEQFKTNKPTRVVCSSQRIEMVLMVLSFQHSSIGLM